MIWSAYYSGPSSYDVHHADWQSLRIAQTFGGPSTMQTLQGGCKWVRGEVIIGRSFFSSNIMFWPNNWKFHFIAVLIWENGSEYIQVRQQPQPWQRTTAKYRRSHIKVTYRYFAQKKIFWNRIYHWDKQVLYVWKHKGHLLSINGEEKACFWIQSFALQAS